MVRIVATITMLAVTFAAAVFTQPPPDPARAAGITVMRAVNTAEAAARQQSGKYLLLPDLINHAMFARVRADIVANGDVITYRGQQLRVTLSADGLQYQAMVVPAETCGTATFSDERGLIYTGKVLDC